MVLLQAMASGVAVVAANSRALPEFVGAANGVLVNRTIRRDSQSHSPICQVRGPAVPLGAAGRRCVERLGLKRSPMRWKCSTGRC